MTMPSRVVLDCMLFLQAVTSENGAAFACFALAEHGKIDVYVTPAILGEVQDVLTRPILRNKFPALTPERVAQFLVKFQTVAYVVADPPNLFQLPRDPKDQLYTNLSIAIQAHYLVTWNERHLTYLMRQDTPEGKDFCQRFPFIKIVTPPVFLSAIRALTS